MDFLLYEVSAQRGDAQACIPGRRCSPDGGGAVKASAGSHVCLDALTELLDTGTTDPLVEADTSDLEAAYQAELARL
jgi:hypothetical protein